LNRRWRSVIFITGGAYQGKTAFALSLEDIRQTEVFSCDAQLRVLPDARVVTHIERFHLSLTRRGLPTVEYWQENIDRFSDAILIADDISCGVVPMDPVERAWREACGQANAFIAARADRVYRVFCGLAVRLK